MKTDLLADLNEPQRQAVQHIDGPLLVLAGAGSGKTRVITRRVAYLTQQGIAPWNILAITFTNKAAGEMRERVKELGTPRGTTVCTFHALCARLLKEFPEQAGLSPTFSIYDRDDQLKLVKQAMGKLDLPTGSLTPAGAHSAISNAKNELKTADDLIKAAATRYARNIGEIYAEYQRLLAAANALDFDDMLLKVAYMMRDHPDVRDALGQRYRYMLIDEYQDTNRAQYIIAHGIAMAYRNICATGDPDQSIYAWRGADINNILEFESDYPDAVVVRLEENYRSTAQILGVASQLISKNEVRKEKSLWTRREGGSPVNVVFCDDEHSEARLIAERIEKYRIDGGRYGDIAVFYRVNSLSRVLEEALMRAGIPYQIARGVEFYNRKEIKDVIAYLRLMVNPADDLSCRRVINLPARGIGDTTVNKLAALAAARGISLLESCAMGADAGLSAATAKKVRDFHDMICKLAAEADGPVRGIMENVIKVTGLEKLFMKDDEDSRQARANIDELVSAAEEFDEIREGEVELDEGDDQPPVSATPPVADAPSDKLFADESPAAGPATPLAEYLNQVSLVSDVDRFDGSGGSVCLMTMHAAKGLEFPVVFIAGCEDGLMPFERPDGNFGGQKDAAKLEEERRLAFVGITRAMDQLTLTAARYRMIRGKTTPQAVSPFVGELGKEGVQEEDRTSCRDFDTPYRGGSGTAFGKFYQDTHERRAIESFAAKKKFSDGGLRYESDDDVQESIPLPPEYEYLREGCRVRHAKFGMGKVIKLSQPWPETRAKILFNEWGPKVIVLARTSLEVMDS